MAGGARHADGSSSGGDSVLAGCAVSAESVQGSEAVPRLQSRSRRPGPALSLGAQPAGERRPRIVFLHTHTHTRTLLQLLSDMGAALDWFTGLYLKYGWKSTKLVMGPMWYMLICLHPDTVKIVLRGGGLLLHP